MPEDDMKPPVFLLSSGRCGSTLVQRILNTYTDVTIWGEHAGVLRSAAEQYFRLLELADGKHPLFENRVNGVPFARDRLTEEKSHNQWQAWLNWFNPSDLTPVFRNHVLSLFRPSFLGEEETWGFKEIRYGMDDRVIEFLSCLFPDAIFVFLVRDGYNTIASQVTQGWNVGAGSVRLGDVVPGPNVLKSPRDLLVRKLVRNGFDKFVGRLKQWHRGTWIHQIIDAPRVRRLARAWVCQNGTLWEWHQSGKIRSFWITFEDVAAGKPVLDPVLRALGKSFGPEQGLVIEAGEGRGEGGFSDKRGVGERWRTLGSIPLAITDWVLGSLNEELGYPSPDRARWTRSLRHMMRSKRQQVVLKAGR
jgi:hypothetical protein